MSSHKIMYQYTEQDRNDLSTRRLVFQRQLERYVDGKMSEEDFRPIRLQQGLYIQRHAPMLRVAVPYGMLSALQLRTLAEIAQHFDKGYCHITTRQNVQFNWIQMESMTDALAILANADMHSIQTSGNCIRNITSDPFAGIAEDELIDPRPYCELIRQWSLGHPEFAYLPRKFKIAITGSRQDRAMIMAHDIGLRLTHHLKRGVGFEVIVGGGLGRTPVIGTTLSNFVPEQEILGYLTAILRVYNRHGRRDNKYKARIKILVKSIGIDAFREQVNDTWKEIQNHQTPLDQTRLKTLAKHFIAPVYESFDASHAEKIVTEICAQEPQFEKWFTRNTQPHKVPGYRSVTLSLKKPGQAPGDLSSQQLVAIADLAERYSFGVARTTHEQNLVLADVKVSDLYLLWKQLEELSLATPNVGTLHDMICCPGLDYCSLANTPSIPVAKTIQSAFDDLDYLYDIGDLSFNISGCMNACAHHHVANIGILGVDKKGEHFFQISLGGKKGNEAKLGKILGPAFSKEEIPSAIRTIIETYLAHRNMEERFIDTFERIGLVPFKEAVYANAR